MVDAAGSVVVVVVEKTVVVGLEESVAPHLMKNDCINIPLRVAMRSTPRSS
ncbi:MAG: hypothetical protein ACHQ1E_00240 [Ktedonobacterales bacterium]|jgi:hypothetical protein